MTRRMRLVAVVIAFLLPPALLNGWFVVRGEAAEPSGLARFPRSLASWALVREDALSSEERALLVPNAYLAWHFEAPERGPVSLYVALYDGASSDGKGAHDPALCYPASGWEVTATRAVRVALSNGETISARMLTAHMGETERKALYWFQPAARWPGRESWEQVARIGDALAGHRAFAFVRLSAAVEEGRDTERDLLDFAASVGSPVRAALMPDSDSGR